MTNTACTCLRELQLTCFRNVSRNQEYSVLNDPEIGRIVYTCAILAMFAFVIVLLMFRSIKRNSSTIEVSSDQMEALLDAMRFREELDIQQRQRRRLLKAKTKVTAWLTKANGNTDHAKNQWKISQQNLLDSRKQTNSSTTSGLPEIVITEELPDISRSRTPALSLIYDFERSPDRVSLGSSASVVCMRGASSSSSLQRDYSPRGSVSLDMDNAPRLSIWSGSMSFD